jgi:hypothetical protein
MSTRGAWHTVRETSEKDFSWEAAAWRGNGRQDCFHLARCKPHEHTRKAAKAQSVQSIMTLIAANQPGL